MILSIPGKYPTFSNIYLVQNKKRVQTFNSRWKLWPTSSQANWCTLYEKQIFKKSFGIVFFLVLHCILDKNKKTYFSKKHWLLLLGKSMIIIPGILKAHVYFQIYIMISQIFVEKISGNALDYWIQFWNKIIKEISVTSFISRPFCRE